jgi:hypothetical protein
VSVRQNILDWIDSHGDPITLYREVYATSPETIRTDKLGRFWTPDKKKAHSPHGYLDGNAGVPIVIQATARRSDVDEMETVATMRRYPGEREIRLAPGSSVTIQGFHTPDGFQSQRSRGKVGTMSQTVAARYAAKTLDLTGDRPITKTEAKKLKRWWESNGYSVTMTKAPRGLFYLHGSKG